MVINLKKISKKVKSAFSKENLKRLASSPFYFIIFAMWPILAVYFKNRDEIYPSQVFQALMFSIIFFVAVFFIIRKIIKNTQSAGLVTGLMVLVFFFYMSFYNKFAPHFKGITIFGTPLMSHSIVISLILIGFIALIFLLYKYKPKLGVLRTILNAVSVVLIASTLYNITLYELGNHKARTYDAKPKQGVDISEVTLPDQKPDIYYFVFDRYASNETLKNIYDFDNSEFLNKLSDEGFYTNDKAHSNYPFTPHSLASSLNMQYLDDLGNKLADNSSMRLPLFTLIKNNKVAQTLQDAGYTYVQAGSWWNGSRTSDIADIEFNKAVTLRTLKKDFIVSEFGTIILQETILQPILTKGISLFGLNIARFNNLDVHRKYAEYQFDHMDEISKVKGPKFVFSHILLPHPPYIYDKDGTKPPYPGDLTTGPPEAEKYINQLIYTNSKIQEMIATIKSNSDQEPIIILQADEGPYPKEFVRRGAFYDWTEAPKDDLQQKFGILLSIHEPDQSTSFTGTPVNIFPYIFNKYLNIDIAQQDNKVYIYRNNLKRYEFYDITEKVLE